MCDWRWHLKEAAKGAIAGALLGTTLALALIGALSLTALKVGADAGLSICAPQGASHD